MIRNADGKLASGEYYDVILYWHGASRWSLAPEPPVSITFRCVGHTTVKSERWVLNNISPNQPLPPLPLHRGSYLPLLAGLLKDALMECTGKQIIGLYRIAVEQPKEGPGAFWRNVPDLSVVANYSAAMETTPILNRVIGNAFSVGEKHLE